MCLSQQRFLLQGAENQSPPSVGRVYEDEFLIDGFATGDCFVAVGLVVGRSWFNEMQKAS